VVSPTAFAATVPTATPKPPHPGSAQSLHLGDTAPSAVLRAAMPDEKPAKPAARWYTPSMDGNTPFPQSAPSVPTPVAIQSEAPKPPKPRRLIVIALALTVALVLAAVLANYFSPQ
jgi:hypothetical protein